MSIVFGLILTTLLLILIQSKYQEFYLREHLQGANERLILGIEVVEASMEMQTNFYADVSGGFVNVDAIIEDRNKKL